jgi:hypothetical protein
MTIYKNVLDLINRGRLGLNTGLPMGFDRLVDFIPNIQQSTYYLIGGETGTGKTGFVDDCFMYNPFDWLVANKDKTDIKMKIIYFSFEIEERIKIIKGICRRIYQEFDVIVDVNYVLSRGKNRISTEIYDKVIAVEKYFEGLEDILTIYDLSEHPTGIDIKLNNYFKTIGRIEKISEYKTKWVPNDPNLYVIAIFDHIGLTKGEKGLYSKKERIDALSAHLIHHRNTHNMIPVVLSQLNRTVSSTERFKLEMVQPQLSDFKDSGNTQEDANIILCLFSPYRYSIATYAKYKAGLLGDRMRGLSILKNRDGDADVIMGLEFMGEIGHFKELPSPYELKDGDYQIILDTIQKKKYKEFKLI